MPGTSYDRAPDGSLMALADCDTFYTSCERVCRPDLIGRPIVVLSNNDGCIIARSREVKALGIPMGEPEFKLRRELERHKVAVFSSNYTLYGDLSHRVMMTLESVVPDVETYSIDEAFLPMPPVLAAHADDVAREVKDRVWQWVGLPISVGVAPTRVLAKIATEVAKKFPQYRGIFNMASCGNVDRVLEWVKVHDIWGVGRKGALKLRSEGVKTALDLRDADPALVRKLLTIRGSNIQMELQGIPAIGEDVPLTHSCVISSRSLGRKARTIGPVLEAAAFYAERAGEKLRRKGLTARLVAARIQNSWAVEDEPRFDRIAWETLPRHTLDSAEFVAASGRLVRQIFRVGPSIAKVMVILADLIDPARGQAGLFDFAHREHDERRKRLMETMDRVNRLEGRGTLRFASQGARNPGWEMKRDRLSPAWTTCLQELLKVSGVPGECAHDRRKQGVVVKEDKQNAKMGIFTGDRRTGEKGRNR